MCLNCLQRRWRFCARLARLPLMLSPLRGGLLHPLLLWLVATTRVLTWKCVPSFRPPLLRARIHTGGGRWGGGGGEGEGEAAEVGVQLGGRCVMSWERWRW
jgi:hypothetical protein